LIRAGYLALLIAAASGAACAPGRPFLILDRVDTTLTIQPDGSVRVEERLTAPAGFAGTVQYARRLERIDGIGDADVIAGQTRVPADEVDISDGLRVAWPVSESTRILTLRYTAWGAVAVRGGHATFLWRPVIAEGVGAGAVRVTLALPAGSVVTGEPYVEGVQWSTSRQGSALVFEHGALPPDRAAVIVVPFTVDARAMLEPQWQIDAERGRDLVPAFVSAGLFIIIVAIGVVIMVRVQYPIAHRTQAVDPARAAVASGLRMAGAVTVLLGAASVPVIEATLGHYGRWPHAIDIGLILSGLLLLLYGARRQI
jgi:hypothetical protein